MATRRKWTVEDIHALGVRMSGVDACSIVYDVGPTVAYEMLAAGEVDFPVIRRGRQYIVPTAAVLELMRLPKDRSGHGTGTDEPHRAPGQAVAPAPVIQLADRRGPPPEVA